MARSGLTLDFVDVVGASDSVRFTYNEDNNVIMTVNGSASQMRVSEHFSRQPAVFWVQTNGSEQEFSMLKNLQ